MRKPAATERALEVVQARLCILAASNSLKILEMLRAPGYVRSPKRDGAPGLGCWTLTRETPPAMSTSSVICGP